MSGGAITGGGEISADGGINTWNDYPGPGGGGGRIAVYYKSIAGSFALLEDGGVIGIHAYGGYGTNSYRMGAAGTVFLKNESLDGEDNPVEPYGTLIIDNKNQSVYTSRTYTMINIPPVEYSSNVVYG